MSFEGHVLQLQQCWIKSFDESTQINSADLVKSCEIS